MNNLKTSIAARNRAANAIADLADDGFLRIYDGLQPLTPETQVAGQTLLTELALGSPAFQTAMAGTIKADGLADDNDAAATGKASWYRIVAADGLTGIWDGTAGESNADLVLNSVAIQI